MMIVSKLAAFLGRYPNWVRLRAGHIRYDHQPALIGTRERDDGFDAQGCADDLMCELQHHCDQFDGEQRYQIVLTDGENEVCGVHVFTLSNHRPAQVTMTQAQPMMDDPDMVRLALRQTAESQRHAENCVSLVLRCNQAMMGQMGGQLLRLSERCTMLEDRHWDTMKMTETMLSERHTRELETAEAERRASYQEQLFGKLIEVAPYLIGSLTGATPVAELLQTIEPDKLRLLMSILNPRQLAMLKDLSGKAERADVAMQVLTGRRPPEPPAARTAQQPPTQTEGAA